MQINNGADLERVKMDNIQVMDVLKTVMGKDQKVLLLGAVREMEKVGMTGRKALAHAIMETYKGVGDNETVKSGFRQLQKKYLNGARDLGGEQEAVQSFIEDMATAMA